VLRQKSLRTENAEAPGWQGDEEGEYRVYLTDEGRRQPECIGVRMPANLWRITLASRLRFGMLQPPTPSTPRIVRTACLVALGLLATCVQPAAAQKLAFELEGGYLDLTNARESASAVFGSSGGFTWGAGLRYGLGERFFVSAGVSYFKQEGERVFVAEPGGQVFPLGHPLSLRLLPVRATLGYRFGSGRIRPYVGLGGGIVSYREESTVGGVTDTNSQTKASGHILAGVELGEGTVRLGAELEYSIIPNTIGIGGVSEIYDETDVGGLTLLVKVVFVFGR